MFARLLLIFILVPLADLILLMVISKYTTVATTIALIVVSGIIGAWLAKWQTSKVGIRIRDRLNRNQMPADLLTDGAMILFAAGLLITPGLLTDLFGFSLLIPLCRGWYKTWAVTWIKNHVSVSVYKHASEQPSDIIEGEVVSKTNAEQDSIKKID